MHCEAVCEQNALAHGFRSALMGIYGMTSGGIWLHMAVQEGLSTAT